MLYFINGDPYERAAETRRVNRGKKAKAKRRRVRIARVARRRRKTSRKTSRRSRSTLSSRLHMARRRRRRHHRAAPTVRRRHRRRHRRNPGGMGPARARMNPRRRRRRLRRNYFYGNPRRRHRRRYRRNPSMIPSARGIVGNIVQGLKDGAAVVGGEVVARKVRGAITGMLPATAQAQVAKGAGYVALSLASSVITSLIARRVLPGQARLITAGAFAETINCTLAQTPIAPYLSAFPRRRVATGVRAWPGVRAIPQRAGVAAWPTMRSVGTPVTG